MAEQMEGGETTAQYAELYDTFKACYKTLVGGAYNSVTRGLVDPHVRITDHDVGPAPTSDQLAAAYQAFERSCDQLHELLLKVQQDEELAAAIDSAVPRTKQAGLNAAEIAAMVGYASKIQSAIAGQ